MLALHLVLVLKIWALTSLQRILLPRASRVRSAALLVMTARLADRMMFQVPTGNMVVMKRTPGGVQSSTTPLDMSGAMGLEQDSPMIPLATSGTKGTVRASRGETDARIMKIARTTRVRRPAAAGGRAGRRLLRVLLKIDGHGDSSEMIHGRRAATHGNDNGGLAESARPTSAALKDVIQWASEGAPGRMVAT